MVQNRNWQKRADEAKARRKEAKQRRQKTEDKRLYKGWVQELFALLDRHEDSLKRHLEERKWILHVWTTTLPSDSPPLLDIIHEDDGRSGGGKRRPRSCSIESDGSGKRGRGRSGSFNEKLSGKKKVHPRSKEVISETTEPELPSLCRSHFFSDKCESARSGKKGSCRHVHYTKQFKTLATVLGGKQTDEDAKNELVLSEAAVSNTIPEDEEADNPDSMEMVYYFPVELKDVKCETTGEFVSNSLVNKQLPIASVVYMALNEVLIFDRHRDGVLLSDREFLITAVGEHSLGNRRFSSVSDDDEVDEELFHLPGTILEHILTFLPDASVAAASQVCKSWYHEIGQKSPNLWKYLLERRDWPLPDEGTNSEADASNLQPFRECFLQHYAAVRDMKAIRTAVQAISHRQTVEEKEMSYIDFSKRKHSPSFANFCVSVQVWSPNRMLAAYSQDCSLRLYETVPVTGSNEIRCKELVCQRVDPYLTTKKRSCQVVSMGLDRDSIGCLCHVMADNVDADAYVLVVLSRDEFLLGESSASPDFGSSSDDIHLNVVDIGEAVLNYLLSSDLVDHRLLQLIDFLTDGGEIGDVEVLVSHSLTACGYGRFMVEVSISIPTLDIDQDDMVDNSTMHLLDRKLVLFSASAGAIVWVGESNPLSQDLRPRHEEMTLAYLRRSAGGSRATCSFAVGCSTSSAIMMGKIEPSGQVQSPVLVEASEMLRNEILEDGWGIATTHRPIIITPTDVVAADPMEKVVNNEVEERKSVVTFYPRFPAVDEPCSFKVAIPNMEVMRLACLREQHIVVLCRAHEKVEVTEFVELQWRAGDVQVTGDVQVRDRISSHAVIIHVQSRREVGRICLLEEVAEATNVPEVPFLSVVSDDTVGLGLSWKGVVMTGSSVRAVGDSQQLLRLDEPATPKSAKKKKKGKGKKSAKKDGFARGMSLRG